MPRAPSNEIPYNVPWDKKGGPQLANMPLVSQPHGRSSRGAAMGAVILVILVILVALYHQQMSSSRSGLAYSRIHTAGKAYSSSSPPRVEIRWGYDPAKPIEGFFIYRCIKTTATDCLKERDYRLVASVGRYTRSFAEAIRPGSIFCYRVSAYNKAGESAQTPLGCRATP